MATKISRVGFGQVEPNHLSAQRTSQIYAQLPADDSINILEQGQFVKYDYSAGKVDFTGVGEWMLVYNEEKLYGVTKVENHKDYAMQKKDFTPGGDVTHGGLGPFKGQMVPRVFKTNVGDIYTTNTVGAANTSKDNKYEGIDLDVKDLLKVNEQGFLVKETAGSVTESSEAMLWEVVKVYTMPDGQPGVKIMRVK